MHYRADVDGLRAIAVSGVVLFHLGLKAIPGGGYPIVEYRDTLPHVLARALSNADTKLPAQAQSTEPYVADSEFKVVATNGNFTYVSVIDAMCSKKNCLTLDNAGYPLQFDYGHLTDSGSIVVIDRIKSAFVKTGSVSNSHAG